ncbi:MAG: S9 family peptidase [Acidobacteriota bacterium]|nr:S9 family peptidase [Acidobacteriota bacterium]
MNRFFICAAVLMLGLSACKQPGPTADTDRPVPPKAAVKPHQLEKHGHVRTDNYYWLRERENPEVISYLEAENEYTEKMTAHTKSLQDKLFEELKGRVKQDDSSVPFFKNGYWYYTRYEEGKQYPVRCRKKGSLDAPEEILLDGNAMAEGHGYFNIRGVSISDNNELMAFGTDTRGRRIYDLQVKNLKTGEILPDKITDVTPNVVWAADNQTLFYTRQDPETLRWYQIYRHKLGTPRDQDVLVYEEKDVTFRTGISRTRSNRYLIIGSWQTLSSESRILEADQPEGEFRVFHPRQRDLQYGVSHLGDKFYIRTNLDAKNFRLMATPVGKTGLKNWTEVIPHRSDVFFGGFTLFKDHLVLEERSNGLDMMRIKRWDGSDDHYLDYGEPTYTTWSSSNPEIDSTVLRYGYSSMTTPDSIFDYDMNGKQKTLKKQEEVLGGFNSADYKTERIMGKARDGVEVPISVVYHKELFRQGENPLLLYAYGSYGASMSASFDSSRLSLLDRGFVYALAHIRGGQEMGRHWYEDGKLLKKKNTFTDFIDCAKHLAAQKYGHPDKLFAMGGSAGGLLVGAVLNMEPTLFKGVMAAVPFVDVVTTMLDESIPLTTGEWDEWGDPNDKTYYDYMLSYSPYDQVGAKDYTNLLVTTGLHDSQVQYWEPAKWVAKLRAMKTDDNKLLLKTDMSSGHGGASGRFDRFRQRAFYMAFLLDLAGVSE